MALSLILPLLPDGVSAERVGVATCPRCGRRRGLRPYSGKRDADFLDHYLTAQATLGNRVRRHELRTLVIVLIVFAVTMGIALLGVRLNWWS